MKNKKKINITVVIILQITIIMLQIVIIGINKSDIKLDKVKLKEIAAYDNSNVSIMIYNNDTSEYEKYTGESFPSKSEYVYSEEDSKCLDLNGMIIEGAIKYFNGKVTIKTNKTSTCYLSFRPGKALTFELGEGVAKVYYKINNDEEYIEANETTVVAVTPGTEYSYYVDVNEGYIMGNCYDDNEHLCTGTMPNEPKTETLSAGRFRIKANTGVGEIYYKLSSASTYSSTISTVTINESSGTYSYYGLPSAGYKISTCTQDVPCTVTIEPGVMETSITAEAITNTNGATYLINLAESNTTSNLIKQTGLETTVQTGNNATTDYRYIGNGQCSYDNGNYIGGINNGLCPTLYNYNETRLSDNKVTQESYKTPLPKSTSSYAYECIAEFEGTKISDGPNNYVCLGNLQSNGQCQDEEHLYRIIGVMPTQTTKSGAYENRLKLIKSLEYLDDDKVSSTAAAINYTFSGYGYRWTGQLDGSNLRYKSYTGASSNYNNWEESTLNRKILNQTYYNNLDEKYQNMIGDSVWYLGGNSTSAIPVSTMYTAERSEKKYTTNPTYAERKIGLMYPSDYGYATSGGNSTNRSTCLTTNLRLWGESDVTDCKNNDWLFITGCFQWMITNLNNDKTDAYILYNSGFIHYSNVYSSPSMIRPTFFLTSEIKLTSGTGSINSPYTLGN